MPGLGFRTGSPRAGRDCSPDAGWVTPPTALPSRACTRSRNGATGAGGASSSKLESSTSCPRGRGAPPFSATARSRRVLAEAGVAQGNAHVHARWEREWRGLAREASSDEGEALQTRHFARGWSRSMAAGGGRLAAGGWRRCYGAVSSSQPPAARRQPPVAVARRPPPCDLCHTSRNATHDLGGNH